jgi:hypothetical protein
MSDPTPNNESNPKSPKPGAKAQPPKAGQAAAAGAAQPPAPPVRTLNLVKGQHRFSFRYEVGEEPTVLDALVDMVNRREVPFDWFDAAVLSHQLGQHLAKELTSYLPKKAA